MSRTSRFALSGAMSVCFLFGLAVAARGEDDLWTTDFSKAKAKAKAEKKLMLVDFTGSDWCGWCIKLRNEVFNKDHFKAEAPKQFVLVELDYPHNKKLSEELTKQNKDLAEHYKVHGFPTVLMLDAEGQVIAHTGYRKDGPEEYVKHLSEFAKIYDGIVTMRKSLESVQGLERAKLLDKLIDSYVKLSNEIDELEAWSKEIVGLDADNKAGLKGKHEFRLAMAEAIKLKAGRKLSEAKAAIEKALAISGITAEQKQDAWFAQGECCYMDKDFAGIVACLQKALDAAPDSPKASLLKGMIERFKPMGDAQALVVKLKTDLEKAAGLDRAKVLDQLLDARTKLAGFLPDSDLAQDMERWAKEILTLDPENKTGLKQKYGFHVLLTEAHKLAGDKKFAEAQSAADKALELKDLKPEQVQEGNVVKGECYLAEKDFQKAQDCLKKALDAAPDARAATVIKILLRRCEQELEKKAKE